MKKKKRQNNVVTEEEKRRLAKRDGVRCMEHHRRGVRGITWALTDLIVHHIDNDCENNNFNNKELLCRGCNHLLDSRKEGGQFGSFSFIEKPVASSAEMQRNSDVYPRWIEYLKFFMDDHPHGYPASDFVDESAYVFGISQVTVSKRWLRAHTCRLAPYMIDPATKLLMPRDNGSEVTSKSGGPSPISLPESSRGVDPTG